MIAGMGQTSGAPCPTAVLDANTLLERGPALIDALAETRAELHAQGLGHVLKFAITSISDAPGVDLDYRFAQGLPEGLDQFDFRGSCGHSILAAVTVGAAVGWVPPLTAKHPVRVRVLNNGGRVICSAERSGPETWCFVSTFVNDPPVRFSDLLLTGRPVDRVLHNSKVYDVSLVSMGNPYVFVRAEQLGLTSREALFTADDSTLQEMMNVRDAAARLLEWPVVGAFPKVAALGVTPEGRLYGRAVSVPSWHPTLALTGASCLAAAATIPGTIPNRMEWQTGSGQGPLRIETPGGLTEVSASIDASRSGGKLRSITISGKEVRLFSHTLKVSELAGNAQRA